MDAESEAVALQLQLDDINAILQERKDENEVLSLQTSKQEFERALAVNQYVDLDSLDSLS